MRRYMIALVVMTLGGFLLVALTSQAAPRVAGPCDYVGTDGRDVVTGNGKAQRFCLRGGNDYAHGRGGNDTIQGDGGTDTLIGGNGSDTVIGGPGRDNLFVVDGQGGDKIIGGGGVDKCYVDRGDKATQCHVYVGFTKRYARALERALIQVMDVTEELIEDAPTVTITATPAPTITETITQVVTVTRTASFPPCSPPPGHTPAPC